MSLLPWSQVVCGMAEDEGECNANRDGAENGAKKEAETVESDTAEERVFVDIAILKGGVAVGPRRGVG